jgi:hypothetical protein
MADSEATSIDDYVVPRMTTEEVHDLARRIVTNQVFITGDPDVVRMSFLVVALGGCPENTALVYEEYTQASERSINGYPMFFSAKFVHVDDAEALVAEAKRLSDALAPLPAEETPMPDD